MPVYPPNPPNPPNPGYPPYPGYPPHPYQAPYAPYYMPPQVPPKQGGVPWWVWLIGGCAGAVVIASGACVLLGLAFGSFMNTFANLSSGSANTSQSFTVTGTPSVVAHIVSGNITIKAGSPGTVGVDVSTIATDTSPTNVQQDLSQMIVTPTQSGNTISIISTAGGSEPPVRQLTTDLVITVPPSSNLDLRTLAGNVEISDVTGTIAVNISAGDLSAQGITLSDGSNIAISVGTATINGALASGASATIHVSTGTATLTLPTTTTCHVDATADTGDITLSGWTIPVTQSGVGAHASGDLGAAPSGTLTIQVNTGSIVLAQGT